MSWQRMMQDFSERMRFEDQLTQVSMAQELARGYQAEIELWDRLAWQRGEQVALTLRVPGEFSGTLLEVSQDWLLLGAEGRQHIITVQNIQRVATTQASVVVSKRDHRFQLSVRSALHIVQSGRFPIEAMQYSGERVRGYLHEVGADYVVVQGIKSMGSRHIDRVQRELTLLPTASLGMVSQILPE